MKDESAAEGDIEGGFLDAPGRTRRAGREVVIRVVALSPLAATKGTERESKLLLSRTHSFAYDKGEVDIGRTLRTQLVCP